MKTIIRRNRKSRHSSRAIDRRLRLKNLEDRSLLSAGQLDLTFGDAGKVLTNFSDAVHPTYPISGFAAYQSDGKVVVAGSTEDVGGYFAVVRHNSDGSLDTSFGVDGIITIDFGTAYARASGLAVDSLDRIVLAGSAGDETGWDFAVARLTAGGANVIEGNQIGGVTGNGGFGISITGGSAGNRIGTNGDAQRDEAERNVIVSNGLGGIAIGGLGADDNIVAGNYIGTDAAGTALGNSA